MASYCDGDKCSLWRSLVVRGRVFSGCVFVVEFDIKMADIV